MENISSKKVYSDIFENNQNADAEKRGWQGGNVFDPRLFRENAEIAVSKLERYLSDFSVRGLALTDPSILLQVVKDL